MKPDNIDFDRRRFEEANNYYGPKGLSPQTSQLRFEQALQKGKGVYELIVNREGIKRATETYLKRNDLFIVKSIFVALMVETNAMVGHAPLLTYPVLEAGMSGGYKGFKNNHAEAIYNGSMSIMTGQTANYQALPLRRFRYVPESPVGVLPRYKSDDVSLNLPERFAFAGTQDQKITISFPYTPETDPTPVEATETSFLVVIVDGWLVEGGTNDKFKEMANPYGKAI